MENRGELAEPADGDGVHVPEPARDADGDVAARRAAAIESGLRLYRPLTRFVERELACVAAKGLTAPDLSVTELTASIFLTAQVEVDDGWPDDATFPWFRRLARNEIGSAVGASGCAVGASNTGPRLAGLLDTVPVLWREIFVLNAMDGWSAAHIAAWRGIDTADVKAIVRRAWAFIGEWLREESRRAAD